LFEFEPRAFWKMVHTFNDDNHPGYTQFVKWLRGKCFPTIYLAKPVYESSTGHKVKL